MPTCYSSLPRRRGTKVGRLIVNPERPARRLLGLAALLALLIGALASAPPASSRPAKAQAPLQNPPLKLAIFVSTRGDLCFDPGDVAAITHMAREAEARVNSSFGIAGRRLEVELFDDDANPKLTVANVRSVLADPRAVAMIGLTNTQRAKEVFDKAGGEIKTAGIPWLSNISVNSLFEEYPTVFTMRGAQEDDSIPVLARFVQTRQAKRLAFVAVKDQIFSAALLDGLKARLGAEAFVADYRFTLKDDKIVEAEIAAMVETLKQASPDFVFLNLGTTAPRPCWPRWRRRALPCR